MRAIVTLEPTNTALTHAPALDSALLAGQVAPGTLALYRRDLAQYAAWAANAGRDPLDPGTLAEWRAALVAVTRDSPKTINRKLSSVRAVAMRAAEAGRLPADVWLRFKGVRGVKVSAMRARLKPDARTRIDPADMRRLCDAPDVATLPGLMHRALLLTLATSGLRIHELVTLTPAQIAKRGASYIVTVTGKGSAEPREAPLSVEAHHAIETWLVARPVAAEWIFTGFGGRGGRDPRADHIHPVSGWEIVKRYAAAVGLTGVKPHDFRRFVGTNLAKRDLRQAQKALGHKDINTTAKHYVLDELEPGLTDGLF
jgi:integrase/recombinase XerD